MKIHGLDELLHKWNAAGKAIRDALFKVTHKAVLYVHSTVPGYPAAPPGSSYRRTETLGRATTTDVRPLGGGGFIGFIGNKVEYAPWVISTERVHGAGPQTWFHKAHGWWTLQGVVEKAAAKVIEIFEDAVKQITGLL